MTNDEIRIGLIDSPFVIWVSSFIRHSGFVILVLLLLSSCRKPGTPAAIWCETGTGPGQVVYPRGIVYKSADDTFFIVDRVARIQHLDHKGNYLDEWQMPMWQLGKPVGIAVGPDGNVWVPDTHYHRVMVYTPDGKNIREFGEMGTGPGQFIYPTDIAFDSTGPDFRQRVWRQRPHQRLRSRIAISSTRSASSARAMANSPGRRSILIEKDLIYVTDASNHRISCLQNRRHVGPQHGTLRLGARRVSISPTDWTWIATAI